MNQDRAIGNEKGTKMAYAVVDSDGTVRCGLGSEDVEIEADTVSDIEFEDNTVSTILEAPSDADFGDCTYWSIITAGSSTACNPAIAPVFSIGVIGVEWGDYNANGDEDIAACSYGGTIYFEDAGTEIEIS